MAYKGVGFILHPAYPLVFNHNRVIHFTPVLNRITYKEVLSVVDETVSNRDIRIPSVSPNRREINSVINALKHSKAVAPDLFIDAPTVIADLLFPLVRKSWEIETFLREWMKEMIVKIPKRSNRFGCDI